MARTGRRDTAPEVRLRSELHRRGLRYSIDVPPLEGVRRRADIVFFRRKLAVFVDGCFWHACPIHATWPKTNADWWKDKLETNKQRDRETDRQLEEAGWDVVRVWEHEDPVVAAERIELLFGRDPTVCPASQA
jgi:DNA mismatch endonuclease, patch repair protein